MRTDLPIGHAKGHCPDCGLEIPLTVHADAVDGYVHLVADLTNYRAHQLEHPEDS